MQEILVWIQARVNGVLEENDNGRIAICGTTPDVFTDKCDVWSERTWEDKFLVCITVQFTKMENTEERADCRLGV